MSDEKKNHEPFVEVPEMFHRDLTAERYRARLELYQRAYELARRQAAERKKPFNPPFQFDADFESGGGI